MTTQLTWDFNSLDRFSFEKYFQGSFDIQPYLNSHQGVLFEADCLKILPNIKDEIVDVIFADPPFNLGKNYGNKSNDSLADSEYLNWCFAWINECCRILKPGGSLFIYNLPKWNILLGS